MDRTSFADAVCDAVDAAGRLGYLGCLHAIVRLAAAREAMPDADGMTCGDLGCLAGLRRQARATDTLDAESFTARTLAALDIKGADRTAFQTAAMRLADMLAPGSRLWLARSTRAAQGAPRIPTPAGAAAGAWPCRYARAARPAGRTWSSGVRTSP